jgi:hypothetical protein
VTPLLGVLTKNVTFAAYVGAVRAVTTTAATSARHAAAATSHQRLRTALT